MMSGLARSMRVQLGALDFFTELVTELGGDPYAILRAAAIRPDILAEPEAQLPLDSYRHLLALAANATGDDAFGIQLGMRQSFSTMGSVGYLLKNAPNVRQMLTDAADYLRIHNPGIVLTLAVEEGMALITFNVLHIGQAPLAQHFATAQALLTGCMRELIDPGWSPGAVYFQEPEPRRAEVYRRFFRCPLYFDQVLTATEFPAQELAREITSRDDRLYRIFRAYLRQEAAGRRDDVTGLVRIAIQRMFGERKPTLDTVATKLGLSASQLQRRLRREGSTFQAELAEVRITIAKHYLAETDEPLSVIADTLGFAEPAVFTRAFRRAAGESPREWRRKARGALAG